MKIANLVILALLLAFTGCATKNTVLVNTETVVGISVAQNQSTGLYEARLGYVRHELALVPCTNNASPNVLAEFRLSSMFAADGGIYQRLAVGAEATTQPGATLLFAKNPDGSVNTNLVSSIFKPISTNNISK